MSKIDFSAQFGGSKSAEIALPYFRSLKKACSGLVLNNFPLPELAFILRVDGDIHKFEFSGIAYPKLDNKKKYVSFDIGISTKDIPIIEDFLKRVLINSTAYIAAFLQAKKYDIDITNLELTINELCKKFSEIDHI